MDRWVLRVLWPLVHWSDTRQAWVLRGVGRWLGPAFVERQRELPIGQPASADRFTPGSRRFQRRPKSEATTAGRE